MDKLNFKDKDKDKDKDREHFSHELSHYVLKLGAKIDWRLYNNASK